MSNVMLHNEDSSPEARIFRWIVDVEHRWQPPENGTSTTATVEWASLGAVEDILEVLLPQEQARVKRFFHVRDAKLCLASYILKRRAISRACHVPWSQALLSEDINRRPCFQPPEKSDVNFDFNVSHHGTLVVLVGCTEPQVRVGVDVVQIPWVRDVPLVLKDGFKKWISTYEDVFSLQEIDEMVNYPMNSESSQEDHVKCMIRNFYAHWCLKEAFIKMQGAALLATWLQELEFRNVVLPSCGGSTTNALGHRCWSDPSMSIEVWLRGHRLNDVTMELQSLGNDYFIAAAISRRTALLPQFEIQQI